MGKPRRNWTDDESADGGSGSGSCSVAVAEQSGLPEQFPVELNGVPADIEADSTSVIVSNEVAQPHDCFNAVLQRKTESIRLLAAELNQLRQHVVDDVTLALDLRATRLEDRLLDVLRDVEQQDAEAESSSEPLRSVDATVSDPDAGSESRSESNSNWDGIRQHVLNAADVAEVTETSSCDVQDDSDATIGGVSEIAGDEDVPVTFEIPAPIDPYTTEEAELREAFAEREALVRLLSRRLRQQIQQRSELSAYQLHEEADSLSDDLRTRVEHSLDSLNQQVRLGELELSLERARMARELTQLEETRVRVESMARRFGMTVNDDGTLEGSPNPADQHRSGSRWMRVLGFGRSS